MPKKFSKKEIIIYLQNQSEKLRGELFGLRFQNAMGELQHFHRIREIRRKLARILTLLQRIKVSGENIEPLWNLKKTKISQKFQDEVNEYFKIAEQKVTSKIPKTITIDDKNLVKDNKTAQDKELINKDAIKKTIVTKAKTTKVKSTKTNVKTSKKEVRNDAKK